MLVALTSFSCFAKVPKKKNAGKPKIENKIGVIHLTKAEFLKKVADIETSPDVWKYLGDKPALIDFYADWCGPCKKLSPIVEEIAEEYNGRIYVYKVNVDDEKDLTEFFEIRNIPSLIFAPLKGNYKKIVGGKTKDELREEINTFLLKK